MTKLRIERDSMGEVQVPVDALWGAQTQRAVENFPISGESFGRRFLGALGEVKSACAHANMMLGLLDSQIGMAIQHAAGEVAAGDLDAHFPVDVYQTGSGTSTNMNANEVIANRAAQALPAGARIHPNDHVNMSQSSNDVIPTVIHVAVMLALRDDLAPALTALRNELALKASEFDPIVKTGRTHLQDATPIRLGQVFGGYCAQVDQSLNRVSRAIGALRELPLGGTAVGTGVNCPAGFPALAIGYLNEMLGADFIEASNHVEANSARDALIEVSGYLKTIAISLHKIANDIRWLASGPRNGLGELVLPPVQPGSSIMPGKVNPVIAEALIMACAQVIGYDAANALCGVGGYFELNTMMPLLAHNLLTAVDILSRATRVFLDRCLKSLTADTARCAETLARNLALATALAPAIGYDQAAEIAKEAQRTGRTIREVALSRHVLSPEELDRWLDARRMTEPGLVD